MNISTRLAVCVIGFIAAVSSTSLLHAAPPAFGQESNTTGSGAMGGGGMGRNMMGGNMMGPGGMGGGMMEQNQGSVERHQQFMTQGVPEPYASMRDPLPDTPQVVSHGRSLYQESCASCHGPRGLGNGEEGQQFTPPPSNLAALMAMPMMRDARYLYWAIAEGGIAAGTGMPAFKDAMPADDIWSLVRFLQAGLPESDGAQPR